MIKNKQIISVITISIVLLMSFSNLTFSDNMYFKDISNSYARQEIEELYKEGIISGKGQGVFNPKDKMTRAELAKVLALSLDLKEDVEMAKSFVDVSQDEWYAGYIGALVKTGITSGTSSTTFSPNKNVTRQELAVFLIRALELEESVKKIEMDSIFSDKDEIDSWARNHVVLAYEIGLLTGIENSDGTYRFQPKEFAERQALAILIHKFSNNKIDYILKAKRLTKPLEEDEDIPGGDRPIKPIDPPRPVEPPKPEISEIPDPIEPLKPKPKPTKPPKQEENESIKIENLKGRQKLFMGGYLITMEFDIIGELDNKEIKVVVNDGTTDSMTLKEGIAESRGYYFDGMVMSIDSIIIYIGNEKVDVIDIIDWR